MLQCLRGEARETQKKVQIVNPHLVTKCWLLFLLKAPCKLFVSANTHKLTWKIPHSLSHMKYCLRNSYFALGSSLFVFRNILNESPAKPEARRSSWLALPNDAMALTYVTVLKRFRVKFGRGEALNFLRDDILWRFFGLNFRKGIFPHSFRIFPHSCLLYSHSRFP